MRPDEYGRASTPWRSAPGRANDTENQEYGRQMSAPLKIEPVDPTLARANQLMDLGFLAARYPWPSALAEQLGRQPLAEDRMPAENAAKALDSFREALKRDRPSHEQAGNDALDALLGALDRQTGHEYFTTEHICADLASIRNGLTTQHWLAALIDLDGQGIDRFSDGYQVGFWHVPDRGRREFDILVEHKHWWETDRTEFIQLTAHPHQPHRPQGQDPEKRGPRTGSALVLWPWI